MSAFSLDLRRLAIFAVLSLVAAAASGAGLAESFLRPADSARPRTYWFHMSGNITKAGITADLEAMKEIGLAGTLFMNVSVALPTGPDSRAHLRRMESRELPGGGARPGDGRHLRFR